MCTSHTIPYGYRQAGNKTYRPLGTHYCYEMGNENFAIIIIFIPLISPVNVFVGIAGSKQISVFLASPIAAECTERISGKTCKSAETKNFLVPFHAMQIFCICSYEVCAPGRVEYAKIIFHHETDNRTSKIDDAIGIIGKRIKRWLKFERNASLGNRQHATIRHSKPRRAFLFNRLSRVYQHYSVLIIDMCLCSLAIGNTFSVHIHDNSSEHYLVREWH